MRKPYLCPKCEGERPAIRRCIVCNGKGIVWSPDDDDSEAAPVEVRKKVIIEEIEVIKKYIYPPTVYPAYPAPSYPWTGWGGAIYTDDQSTSFTITYTDNTGDPPLSISS